MMAVKLSRQKGLLVLTLSLMVLLIILQNKPKKDLLAYRSEEQLNLPGKSSDHLLLFNSEEIHNLSTLGRVLFIDEVPPNVNSRKIYKILVWKYGPAIETRHIKKIPNEKVDPFRKCPVKNCKLTYKGAESPSADLIIFHLHRMKGKQDLPHMERNQRQIWAFLTDESPYHTFLHKNNRLADYDGLFNWSMTYRMDSDIPVPYGRTVRVENTHPDVQLEDLLQEKRRDVLVAIMGSNCGGVNHRWQYVHELKRHISVDIYGNCGTLRCPGHFHNDCSLLSQYMFYLAFENANCDQYLTEKLWWNAYEKTAIPIVMGANKESYERLAPHSSYINIEDFAKPRDLAQYVLYLNSTGEFLRYHEWRRSFRVLNEHGYFGTDSFHYCRACEALNYNDRREKVYRNLSLYWNVQKDCHKAWNQG